MRQREDQRSQGHPPAKRAITPPAANKFISSSFLCLPCLACSAILRCSCSDFLRKAAHSFLPLLIAMSSGVCKGATTNKRWHQRQAQHKATLQRRSKIKTHLLCVPQSASRKAQDVKQSTKAPAVRRHQTHKIGAPTLEPH